MKNEVKQIIKHMIVKSSGSAYIPKPIWYSNDKVRRIIDMCKNVKF